jgi:nucleoside-diphosphate-sugar epimerase
MKIAITGHSGLLGQAVIAELLPFYEIVRLGRSNSDIEWTLGVLPAPEQLQGIEAIIHLAWSQENRRDDFHINIGGTQRLAQLANRLEIPFLFISTVAALGDSDYGKSKIMAEQRVLEEGGGCVRLGLIVGLNRYQRVHLKINPILNSSHPLNYTHKEDLIEFLFNWLNLEPTTLRKPEIHSVVSGTKSVKTFFCKPKVVNVYFPVMFVRVILKGASSISKRSRNSLDSLNSLLTTPRVDLD